jgi:large subunit ribosomal protein L6
MSRIGKIPVPVPSGVDVQISEGNFATVKGPKGTLEQQLHPKMNISKADDGTYVVTRPDDGKESRSLHGLTRTLLSNMVIGVTTGFTKELEVQGVGYRVTLQGQQLVMNLGYSHQVIVDPPTGISVAVPSPNRITITGCNKQAVGQFAANVREKRPPEPYKGKGVRYLGEVVRHKAGKAGGKKK